MPYSPKDFDDVGGQASMAPSELQPPLNYADGGAVNWAGDSTVYNTQSQIGNMMATPGGFSGMSHQFTSPVPMAMAEGGSIKDRLRHEFSKRGLDFDKAMERRYAYGGDVRGGDNPGGLSGDTGAYSGRSDYGQHESINAAMGRESPEARDISYTGGGGGSDRGGGGGGRETAAYVSPTSDITVANLNAQRAAQEPSQLSFGESALNAINQLLGMGRAEAANYAPTMMSVPQPNNPVYNDQGQLMGMTGRGRNYNTTTSGLPAIAFATSGGKSTPIGVGGLSDVPGPGASQINVAESPLTMPNLRDAAEAARLQAQLANEAAARQAAATPSGTYTASYNVPEVTDPFASQMANLQAKIANLKTMPTKVAKESPFAAYKQATTYDRPFEKEVAQSSGTPFSKIFDALVSPAAAAESKLNKIASMTNTPWPGQSNAAANVPFPVPREVVPETKAAEINPPIKAVSAKTQQEPVLSAVKTTAAAPAAVAPKGIFDQLFDPNANAKRIAELEQAGEFAGGDKAAVASALGVDPSELKSRIVNYDGKQKVDYYTKGLDQVLGEMISGPFKAIGNLFGGGNYDLKNGYSITPSGDVIKTPVYTAPAGGGGGGGGGMSQAAATPVAPVVAAAPVAAPVVPPQALAAFKRKYVPLANYASYGYGPEATLYDYAAAEGGPVGPLSQKRK